MRRCKSGLVLPLYYVAALISAAIAFPATELRKTLDSDRNIIDDSHTHRHKSHINKKKHIPHTEPTCHSHIWPSLVSIVPNNKNTSRNIELMAYCTWIGDQGIVKTGKLRVHLSSRCGLQRTTSPNFQVLAPPSSKGQLSLNCQRGQKNNLCALFK